MKSKSENQPGMRDMAVRLMTWSLMLMAVLTVCLVAGCRLFTIE